MPSSIAWRRRVGAVLAVVGGVAAVVFAARGVDFAALSHHLKEAGPWPLLALGALVGANLWLTAWLNGSLVACFDVQPPVTPSRMRRLTTASQLLNYVPLMWAGLVGRAAFLKRHHGLRLRDSGYITLLTVALTTAVLVLASAGPLLMATVAAHHAWAWAGSILGLAVLGLAVTVAGQRVAVTRRWAWTWVPLRVMDLAASTGRVALMFVAVGHPVTLDQAVLLASGTTLVKLTGLTPNGLGLSEWVVAGLAAALSPVEASLAVAAALLDRAIEVVVSVIAGLWGLWGLKTCREPCLASPVQQTR
ncbi:MAG: lysylphosphatidylglycerol synthase domain-containing protein [Algisphaera sp.]